MLCVYRAQGDSGSFRWSDNKRLCAFACVFYRRPVITGRSGVMTCDRLRKEFQDKNRVCSNITGDSRVATIERRFGLRENSYDGVVNL